MIIFFAPSIITMQIYKIVNDVHEAGGVTNKRPKGIIFKIIDNDYLFIYLFHNKYILLLPIYICRKCTVWFLAQSFEQQWCATCEGDGSCIMILMDL